MPIKRVLNGHRKNGKMEILLLFLPNKETHTGKGDMREAEGEAT